MSDESPAANARQIRQSILNVARLGGAVDIAGAYGPRRGCLVDTKDFSHEWKTTANPNQAAAAGHNKNTMDKGTTSAYADYRIDNVSREREMAAERKANKAKAGDATAMKDNVPADLDSLLAAPRAQPFRTLLASEPMDLVQQHAWALAAKAMYAERRKARGHNNKQNHDFVTKEIRKLQAAVAEGSGRRGTHFGVDVDGILEAYVDIFTTTILQRYAIYGGDMVGLRRLRARFWLFLDRTPEGFKTYDSMSGS